MGLVKCSHHAHFDEAWYLQPHRPPTAQLLYDLGLEADDDSHICRDDPISDAPTMDVNIIPLLPAPWPPIPPTKLRESKWCVPESCCTTLLPLREMAISCPITVAAAQVWSPPDAPPTVSDIVLEYNISCTNMVLVCMSPDPYHEAIEEVLDLRCFNFSRHWTAGLCLAQGNGWLILGGMAPITPAANIPCWQSRIKGAWLIKLAKRWCPPLRRLNTHSNKSIRMACLWYHFSSCTQKYTRTSHMIVSLLYPPLPSHNIYMINLTTDGIS
jgi:hypothetical protein